ncbi:MAG: hypothetical protein H6509_07460 [Bryobacterales bacterium]|nr:hypothetical protein [Acidobacteriota bacterium]MCB9384435.1 hypothetical protein [Bryobacterales bacterium]
MAKKVKKSRRPAAQSQDRAQADAGLVLTEAIADYEAAIESRAPSFSAPTVLTLDAKGPSAAIPEGSVVVFVARKGGANLAQIASAVEKGDLAAVEKVHDRLAAAIRRRIEGDKTEPREIDAVPSYSELRYGSKTIARAIFLETPSSVDARVFAYNGGKLTPGKFQLVQYAKSGRGTELETLVVIRPPTLSALEKTILAQVPAAGSEANISVDMAFIGKIVRAVVNAGKNVVQRLAAAATKLTRLVITVDPQLVTVGCTPGCPTGAALMVATVSYVKVGGKAPSDGLPEGFGETNYTLELQKSATAADLLRIRKAMVVEQLYGAKPE